MSRLYLGDWLIASAGVAFVALYPPLVHAQERCRPWAQMEAWLAAQFGEAPAWVGQGAADGSELIVTERPDGSTWTIVELGPDGEACIRADGQAWAAVPPPVPGEEM